MYAPASRLTRVELDAARTITTGSTRVSNILVCNAGASNREVIFRKNDATEILSIAVLAGTSFGYEVVWIADSGLTIDTLSDAAVSVTVAHTSDGA